MHYDGARLRWANRRVHTPHVVFGEVLYAPGGFCGPRVQQDYELVVLHSGACRVKVDQTEQELTPGRVFLFLPGRREHFQFAADRETHHSYCSVRPAQMPQPLRRSLARAPFSRPLSEAARHLLSAAFRLRSPRNPAAARLIDQVGLCLFAEFVAEADQSAETTVGDRAVRAFLNHVEDHFAEEACLQEACKVAGVSRNTLLARLRVETGQTPARFLWRFRAERGAAMLAETGHTIAEIAYRCGFKNPFHFSRLVSQLLGRSPRLIRTRAWSATPRPPSSPARFASDKKTLPRRRTGS